MWILGEYKENGETLSAQLTCHVDKISGRLMPIDIMNLFAYIWKLKDKNGKKKIKESK